MILVNFQEGADEIRTEALTQWDYNQKLSVSGIGGSDAIYQVHFCNRESEKAIVRMAYLGTDGRHEVNVPDCLLKEKSAIHAYIYLTDYETALGVGPATEGTYYRRTGSEGNYTYTEVNLPTGYAEGATYYQVRGTTIKTILIPVTPRKKPNDYVEPIEPSEEEILDELVAYTNAINHRLDYYNELVREYRNYKWVRVVTSAEYEELALAGKIEQDVIYCIEDDDLYEIVNVAVNEGLNDGSIVVQEATNATNATDYIEGGGIDTKFGDIEQRLTDLGFKEGVVNIYPATDKFSYSLNKKGKRCLFNFSFDYTGTMNVMPFMQIKDSEFFPNYDGGVAYGRVRTTDECITIYFHKNGQIELALPSGSATGTIYHGDAYNIGWDTD